MHGALFICLCYISMQKAITSHQLCDRQWITKERSPRCCRQMDQDSVWINTLRPRRNEQHFADDIFKRIFFNENVWISIKISLKFVPKGPNNNIPALVQIMAWRRSGDKSLSEPMMVSLPTHICVTRPQWVKILLTFVKITQIHPLKNMLGYNLLNVNISRTFNALLRQLMCLHHWMYWHSKDSYWKVNLMIFILNDVN